MVTFDVRRECTIGTEDRAHLTGERGREGRNILCRSVMDGLHHRVNTRRKTARPLQRSLAGRRRVHRFFQRVDVGVVGVVRREVERVLCSPRAGWATRDCSPDVAIRGLAFPHDIQHAAAAKLPDAWRR